jgi:hypothetical protein
MGSAMPGRQSKNLGSASQNEKNILTQRQGCHNFDMSAAPPRPASAFEETDCHGSRGGHHRKSQSHARYIRNEIGFPRGPLTPLTQDF